MAHKMDAKEIAKVSEVDHLLQIDKTPWYRKKNLRRLYFLLVPSALGVEMTSGYDGSVLNGLQSVQPWLNYFNNPQGAALGIMGATISIGGVAAIPFVSYVNDRFGRKANVLFGSIIITIGVIIQTTAINMAMFLVARGIIGFGVPFAINGAAQLIAELSYPEERSVITGLFNISQFVGSILAAGVTLGTFHWASNWSWRLPSLLQILPSLFQLSFIWFVPESPRWLVSKERYDEAFEILAEYHGEGDRDNAFVKAEFQQIRDTIRMEYQAAKTPWMDLFRSAANRRRVLIAACVGIFSQWSGNGLVSYYLSKVLASIGITNKRTQNEINLGLSCFNLVTATCGALASRFLRRRTQYLFAFSGMLLAFACWTAASATYAHDSKNGSAAKAVVALIFVFNMFYAIMQPLTYIFVTEVFPYINRSKGVAITQLFTRAPNGFNQFVNPIAMAKIGWHYYLVYVGWLAVETTIIFFVYPETKGPSLEEVALVLDGSNANVAIIEGKAVGNDSEAAAQVEEVRVKA